MTGARCPYCGAPKRRSVCVYCAPKAIDRSGVFDEPASWEDIDTIGGPPPPPIGENPGKVTYR